MRNWNEILISVNDNTVEMYVFKYVFGYLKSWELFKHFEM